AACNRAGSAPRLSHSDLDEEKARGRFFGVCLANGSVAFLCAGRLSMVPAVAAAVPALHFDTADRHLDCKHHSYILCLASSDTLTRVGCSGLDYASGVRFGGSNRRRHVLAPVPSISHLAMRHGHAE